MSAENLPRAACCVALAFAAVPALAQGLVGEVGTVNGGSRPVVESPAFPYLVDDPLRANAGLPSASSVRLPGDGDAIACPAGLPQDQPVSLGDVVDVALCRNPQVAAAWAAIRIQAAALGEARGAWLPTATATVEQQRTRTNYPGFPAAGTSTEGRTLYGAVNWRLFDFGARAANDEAASRLLSSALAARDAALQKVMADTVQAYFDAMTTISALDARRTASRLARQTLEATQRREAHDASSLGDTLQARTALAKARLAEQRADGDQRKAMSVLVYTAGLPVATQLDLPEEAPPPRPQAMGALAQWLEEAEARHPSIEAARAQVAAARAKVESARRQGLPSIDLVGNYYQNGYPNQGLQPTRSNTVTIGLQLNIPLFEGFVRTYQVRGAQAQVEQSEAQFEDARARVLTTLVRDHADASSALENLDASDDLVRAAEESVASARRRYDKGATDVLELLSTQSALADAQQERVRDLSEWRTARLKLAADAGTLNLAGLDATER